MEDGSRCLSFFDINTRTGEQLSNMKFLVFEEATENLTLSFQRNTGYYTRAIRSLSMKYTRRLSQETGVSKPSVYAITKLLPLKQHRLSVVQKL
jgi:hypothetical protein